VETYHVGIIALAFFSLFVGIAFISWRRRIANQARVLQVPKYVDGDDTGLKCFYVATTFGNRPLDRIVAHGLAHRGVAYLGLSEESLIVSRVGEKSFEVPLSAIKSVSSNSSVIDRAVETNGLLSISWALGQELIDSHFRFVNTEHREALVRQLNKSVGV
jgi:hypothetical protein